MVFRSVRLASGSQSVDRDDSSHVSREDLYSSLARSIGRTPFSEVLGLDLPRGCRVWAKEEYRNPTASHYDREMWRFLQNLEQLNAITPGETRMLETTTGNSGASFSWLCRVLGYPPPTIIIPEDMPRARIAQIRSFGAEVIESPAGQYITGIAETFQAVAPDLIDEQGYYAPQHWNDQYHCVAGMTELGHEIVQNAAEQSVELDYFMLALGNGGSARGAGQVLKDEGIRLLGVEPAESPIIAEYSRLRPTKRWTSSEVHRPHAILGTGPFQPSEIYTNMRYVVENELLEPEILHPSSADAANVQRELMDKSFQHVGMSSAACIWAVRDFIQRSKPRRPKNFGVIFYDPAWKYL